MSRIMPGSSKNTMSGSGKSIGSEAEFATLTRYLGVRIAGTVNAAVPPILSQELQPTYLSCTHNIVEKYSSFITSEVSTLTDLLLELGIRGGMKLKKKIIS